MALTDINATSNSAGESPICWVFLPLACSQVQGDGKSVFVIVWHFRHIAVHSFFRAESCSGSPDGGGLFLLVQAYTVVSNGDVSLSSVLASGNTAGEGAVRVHQHQLEAAQQASEGKRGA